jgi:hypothetical protein
MSLYSTRAHQFSFDSPDGDRDRISAVCNADRRTAFFAWNCITVMVGSIEHFDGFKAARTATLIKAFCGFWHGINPPV